MYLGYSKPCLEAQDCLIDKAYRISLCYLPSDHTAEFLYTARVWEEYDAIYQHG